MAGTRSSARQAANTSSSPPSSNGNTGTKRKAEESSPANKKSKNGPPAKKQMTLEQTLPDDDAAMNEADAETNGNGEGDSSRPERPAGCEAWLNDANYERPEANGKEDANGDGTASLKKPGESFQGTNKDGEDKSDPEKALKDSRGGKGLNALDEVKADPDDNGKTGKNTEEEKVEESKADGETEADAIEEDKAREKALPSNVLEKGIIYFFTRGRVGTDSPDSVQDLARSYFVLRPLPDGAKLMDGTIQDLKNNRLVALPKKVWPKSGKDKFMAFIEKAKTSISELKEEFFSGSEYSTKTTGTQHTPEVTPVGEGVYAFTSTGGGQGTTHLAYMLTIPSEVGEVQKDIGIAEKGSFVVSLKNPEAPGPANAQLPQGPDWPKEYIEEFRGRGWMPAHPKHFEYANAQMLLIGENFDSSNNLEPTAKDEKNDEKETPQEALETLEHEDELRVEHLKGDDTIFADLGLASKDYPKNENVTVSISTRRRALGGDPVSSWVVRAMLGERQDSTFIRPRSVANRSVAVVLATHGLATPPRSVRAMCWLVPDRRSRPGPDIIFLGELPSRALHPVADLWPSMVPVPCRAGRLL
nr:hypothetical protein CFP56_19341 [Quercus suber]